MISQTENRAPKLAQLRKVPRLLGLKDASEYLGISTWTLRSLAEEGKVPVVRFNDGGNGKWFFEIDDLEGLIDRHKEYLV